MVYIDLLFLFFCRDLFNQPRTRNVLPDPESKESKLIILRTDLEKIGKTNLSKISPHILTLLYR